MADDKWRKLPGNRRNWSAYLIMSILGLTLLLAMEARGDKILEQFMSARDDDMLLCVKVNILFRTIWLERVLVDLVAC